MTDLSSVRQIQILSKDFIPLTIPIPLLCRRCTSPISIQWEMPTYSHKVGFAKFVSTVNQTSIVTNNNLFYVQNGISYRGLLSFDSLAKISSHWPVSIFPASLQLTLQSSVVLPFTHCYHLYALSVNSTGESDGAAYAITTRDSTSTPPSIHSMRGNWQYAGSAMLRHERQQ